MGRYSTAVLADSPALYWRLNDTSGTTAADTSGNARTGTYNGTFKLVQGAAFVDDTTSTSASFDGSTAYAISTFQPFVAGSDRTYEFWYYRNNHSVNMAAISNSTGSIMLRLTASTGDFNWFSNTSSSSTNWLAAGPGDSRWVYCVLTHHDVSADNGVAELWIDGVSKGSQSFVTSYTSNNNFTAGARGTTLEFFNGDLTEVAVYTGLLSGARIQAHYDASRGTRLNNYQSFKVSDGMSTSEKIR